MKNVLLKAGALTALIGVSIQPVYASSCSADASLANSWTGQRAGDAHWNLKFRVSPACASGSCNGMVKFRLYYRTARGSEHFESRMAQWRSGGSRSTDAMTEVTSPVCNNTDKKCQMLDVEISEVTCYD